MFVFKWDGELIQLYFSSLFLFLFVLFCFVCVYFVYLQRLEECWHHMTFCSLIKRITPKIRILCFVLINSYFEPLCVWIFIFYF